MRYWCPLISVDLISLPECLYFAGGAVVISDITLYKEWYFSIFIWWNSEARQITKNIVSGIGENIVLRGKKAGCFYSYSFSSRPVWWKPDPRPSAYFSCTLTWECPVYVHVPPLNPLQHSLPPIVLGIEPRFTPNTELHPWKFVGLIVSHFWGLNLWCLD